MWFYNTGTMEASKEYKKCQKGIFFCSHYTLLQQVPVLAPISLPSSPILPVSPRSIWNINSWLDLLHFWGCFCLKRRNHHHRLVTSGCVPILSFNDSQITYILIGDKNVVTTSTNYAKTYNSYCRQFVWEIQARCIAVAWFGTVGTFNVNNRVEGKGRKLMTVLTKPLYLSKEG